MNRKQALKRFEELKFDTLSDKELTVNLIHEIYDGMEGTLEDKKLGPWVWVKTEYCALFKAKNPRKGGKVKESITRMKKMFAAMPEMRKEDVIATAKLYLSQTNSKYIRFPHYFLKKGQGADAIYEFADWYEKYLEAKGAGEGRSSITNTIQ